MGVWACLVLSVVAYFALGWGDTPSFHAQFNLTVAPPFTLTYGHEACSAQDHFAETYREARDSFRAAATAAGCTLSIHPLPGYESEDLTIDVCTLEGTKKGKDSLVLHSSGVHGVEGFAGSAIQSQVLNAIAGGRIPPPSSSDAVFVHAVNPYGFAYLRRWNENSVDLNRNLLSEKEFERVLSADPNRFNYVTFDSFMNPTEVVTWGVEYFAKAAWLIAQNGFDTLKQTIVNGQYHQPKGIFYGGQELQASYKVLQEALAPLLSADSLRRVTYVDVHTGLGPHGVDTLICFGDQEEQRVRRHFGAGLAENRVENAKKAGGAAGGGGYSATVGFITAGIREMLAEGVEIVALTQEFGTKPGVLVLEALRRENAEFHYSGVEREEARPTRTAMDLRDVFYCSESCSWMTAVVGRGEAVFTQAVAAAEAETL